MRNYYTDADPALDVEKSYLYFVRSHSACMDAALDPETYGVGQLPLTPAAPSDVRVSPGALCNRIPLEWSPAQDATEYSILRGVTPEVEDARLLVRGISESSYVDDTAECYVTYYYWVRSHTAYCTAGPSEYASGKVREQGCGCGVDLPALSRPALVGMSVILLVTAFVSISSQRTRESN